MHGQSSIHILLHISPKPNGIGRVNRVEAVPCMFYYTRAMKPTKHQRGAGCGRWHEHNYSIDMLLPRAVVVQMAMAQYYQARVRPKGAAVRTGPDERCSYRKGAWSTVW